MLYRFPKKIIIVIYKKEMFEKRKYIVKCNLDDVHVYKLFQMFLMQFNYGETELKLKSFY